MYIQLPTRTRWLVAALTLSTHDIDILKKELYAHMGVSSEDIHAGEKLFASLTSQGLNWLATIYYDWHPRVGKISVQEVLGTMPNERRVAIVLLALDFSRYSVREDLARSLFSDEAHAINDNFSELAYRWLLVEPEASVKQELAGSFLWLAERNPEAEDKLIALLGTDKQLAEMLTYRIWSQGQNNHPFYKKIWGEIEKHYGNPFDLLPPDPDSHLDGFDNTFYMAL